MFEQAAMHALFKNVLRLMHGVLACNRWFTASTNEDAITHVVHLAHQDADFRSYSAVTPPLSMLFTEDKFLFVSLR